MTVTHTPKFQRFTRRLIRTYGRHHHYRHHRRTFSMCFYSCISNLLTLVSDRVVVTHTTIKYAKHLHWQEETYMGSKKLPRQIDICIYVEPLNSSISLQTRDRNSSQSSTRCWVEEEEDRSGHGAKITWMLSPPIQSCTCTIRFHQIFEEAARR